MERGYTGWLDDIASGARLTVPANSHAERVETLLDSGPGNCTQCGGPGGEVPWGQRETLCWDCTDQQIDLLALACQTETGLPVEVKLA